MINIISSIVIILFESICCSIFFESFCKQHKEQLATKKFLVIVSLSILNFICAIMFSQWLIIKQVMVILVITVVMIRFLSISFKRAIVYSFLYQGLLLLIDYIAYAINYTFLMTDDVSAKMLKVVGNLIIILSKIILFLCVIIVNKKFKKRAQIY